MKSSLLVAILIAVVLTACQKDPVYHGMPDAEVRDGLIVIHNTTGEPITGFSYLSAKHGGITYTRRSSVVSFTSPGDSLLILLSEFTGKDPSKPYGHQDVHFPSDAVPESVNLIGKYHDGQACLAKWPRRKNE